MNAERTVRALGALAHQSRLAIFRMLVQAGPEGLSAGTIATRLKIPPSSLTFHIQHLHHAGLVTQRRMSRQLIYATNFEVMNGLMAYLTENCCGSGVKGCQNVCEPAAGSRTTRRTTKVA